MCISVAMELFLLRLGSAVEHRQCLDGGALCMDRSHQIRLPNRQPDHTAVASAQHPEPDHTICQNVELETFHLAFA